MKKVHNRINSFISKIAFVIENSINIISEDRLLLIYFFSTLVLNLIIKLSSDMPLINLRSFLFNIAWFSLIIALSYQFKKHKSRLTYFIAITTFTYVVSFANILYFRYYESFLSVSLVKQISLFAAMPDSDEMGTSLITTYDIVLWLFYIATILLFVRYAKWAKVSYDTKSNANKKFERNVLIRMAGVCFFSGIIALQGAQYSQLFKLWNRPIVVENYGLANYHIADAIKSVSIFIQPKPSESDYKEFAEYFNERNKTIPLNEYTNVFKGKNVIVIHAESIEQFLINREINGVELTPNINKLANSGYYYSNMYSQESVGTSADTEFVFNASLLPVNNGTIFLTHFDRTYETTQSLLGEQGYYVFSLHGNNGSFWNRSIMHPQLGYDYLYDKDFFIYDDKEDKIGLGISDEEFFRQSINIINSLDAEPYYATLITLTNHTPFGATSQYITKDEYGNEEDPLDCGSLDGEYICNYFKSVRYADWAIGEFMKRLESYKMLDDTIVVLYGDHPANMEIPDLEKLYDEDIDRIEYKAQQKVPFIIWSKDITEPKEIKEVMGMLDAGPTLQNMLGVRNPFNLGHDIHSVENNLVTFINGDWVDNTVYYDSFRDDYVILNDDVDESLITKDYINKQTDRAEEIIRMSNLINKYNLIEEYRVRQNKLKPENGE